MPVTNGFRASSAHHPVKHRHADGHFGLLGHRMTGPQPRAEDRLVAAHRGLDLRALLIAGGALPGQSSRALDASQMMSHGVGGPVSQLHRAPRAAKSQSARLGCDASPSGMSDSVIGPVGRELADRLVNLPQQWRDLRRGVDILTGWPPSIPSTRSPRPPGLQSGAVSSGVPCPASASFR